jgi:hypothetical protein
VEASGQPDVARAEPWPNRSHLGGRYRLDVPIASGGVAIVWLGFDEHLARPVAIKLLHPHHAHDALVVERFEREARAAARINHPNVVRIYDTGHDGDLVYLVMEHVDGPTLRTVLNERGRLDPPVVAALGEQVASALGEAHDNGLVHRDVKPGNILVADDGTVKVTDFGIAKAIAEDDVTLTRPGMVVGTAAYVAPEQLEDREVDARADVYALGVVLYEALVGKAAFSGDTPAATAAMRLRYELLPPRQLRADVPRALDDIVTRATRHDPRDRYTDGARFASALAPLVRAKPADLTAQLLPEGRQPRTPTGERTSDPDATDDAPFVGPIPTTRSEYLGRLTAAAAAGVALALAGTLAFRALSAEDLAMDGRAAGATRWAVETVTLIGVDRADAGDPEAMVDDDVQTTWTSPGFTDRTFDGTREGIGIVIDLGQPRRVQGLRLELQRGGVDVAIHAAVEAPDPALGLEGWGAPRASQVGVRPQQRFEWSETTARYWLVWFTGLSSEGGEFRVEVADIGLLGPS